MTHVTCRVTAKNRDHPRTPYAGQSSTGYRYLYSFFLVFVNEKYHIFVNENHTGVTAVGSGRAVQELGGRSDRGVDDVKLTWRVCVIDGHARTGQ